MMHFTVIFLYNFHVQNCLFINSSKMGIAGTQKSPYLCSRYEENDFIGPDIARHDGGTGHWFNTRE